MYYVYSTCRVFREWILAQIPFKELCLKYLQSKSTNKHVSLYKCILRICRLKRDWCKVHWQNLMISNVFVNDLGIPSTDSTSHKADNWSKHSNKDEMGALL